LAEKRGQFDPYPLLNWLSAEIIIFWQNEADKMTDDKIKTISRYVVKAKNELSNTFKMNPNFWTAVMLADAALIEALSQGRTDENTTAEVAEMYLEVRKLGSPREFESALDQIRFLPVMAESKSLVAGSLDNLLKRLK